MHTINRFSGPYKFLSNFYPTPVEYNGHVWQSSEHAYMSAKSNNPHYLSQLKQCSTSGQAKQLGRVVELRKDWEQVKNYVMLEVLRVKFAKDSPLAFCLLATGDLRLVEGNTWGDTYWGVCKGVGENWLGRMLMQVREELREHA